MRGALFRHYLHIAVRSGVYRASVVVAAVVGALSTLYPVGAHTPGSGPGLLGGTGLGLGAASVLLPFVTMLLLLATAGADEDLELGDEFRLAGIPSPPRWGAALAATAVTALAAMWPAPLTGALAGGGDAVRTGASLTGDLHLRAVPILFAVVAAAYFLTLGFGVLVLSRNSVFVALALPIGFAVFLPLLRVFGSGEPGRWLLRVSPFGPVWSTILPTGRGDLVLKTAVGTRAAVAAVWVALAAGEAGWRLRQDARGR
jgi:hypothetical protein